jgi:hypothetical protein
MTDLLVNLTVENYADHVQAWAHAFHNLSIDKGWWNVDRDGRAKFAERSLPEIFFLIKGELHEAHEEWRKPDSSFKEIYYADGKPEGIPIELADAMIRILETSIAVPTKISYEDLIGPALKVEMVRTIASTLPGNFGHYLDDLNNRLGKVREMGETIGADFIVSGLINVSYSLMYFCRCVDIDLGAAIAIKHDFNKTRPRRHGGKKA